MKLNWTAMAHIFSSSLLDQHKTFYKSKQLYEILQSAVGS